VFGKFRKRIAVAAASAALIAGGATAALAPAASASTAKPAFTPTCVACIHVQNVYAFRGALDALHQATAVNSPIGLWYETPTTTDAGADMLQVTVTGATGIHGGSVNQSNLDWSKYNGDSVVRFKYDPFGNGGANTYIGLQGPNPATATKLALRNDNPNSIWQEFIRVPVSKEGLGYALSKDTTPDHYVLIDVGQTVNPDDPMVVTDPGDAFTGSLVQQDVEPLSIGQFSNVATNQIWDTQN
jgi:hypothetical protein